MTGTTKRTVVALFPRAMAALLRSVVLLIFSCGVHCLYLLFSFLYAGLGSSGCRGIAIVLIGFVRSSSVCPSQILRSIALLLAVGWWLLAVPVVVPVFWFIRRWRCCRCRAVHWDGPVGAAGDSTGLSLFLVEVGVAAERRSDSLLCFPLLWSAVPQMIAVGSISLGCC
jgi:hypothetical protein